MATDKFLWRHIGPRPEDIEEMLKVVGVKSLDELIGQTVPESIRLKSILDLPEPLTESEFFQRIREVAAKNKIYRSFIGQGYYDTISPAVIVRNILENPAWYTSLYAVSGRGIPGTSGSSLEFSDGYIGVDRYGNYQLLFAG